MAVDLPIGEEVSVPPTGKKRFKVNADGAAVLLASDGTESPVSGASGLISGGSNETSLDTAIAQANALGGQTIQLGKGTYSLTSQKLYTANGIRVIGNGPGSTFLEIDDAGGMDGGDAMVVDQVLNFALMGVTVVATTARTAGAFLKIKGKNDITATPAQRTRQYTIEDVDAEDQFQGVAIVNGDTGDGAWGGFINRCEWLRFSAGGVYIDINSPAGGQHYISNMKIYGSHSLASAARALAGVRYRGGADLEMVNVNEVYLRNGLLLDPPTGQAANVTVATSCLWDNNTLASVLATNASGGSVEGLQLLGGWGYTPSANAQPCIQLNGVLRAKVFGMQLWGNHQAVRVTGGSNIQIADNDCGGSIAGIYVLGSASDFGIHRNNVGTRGTTPTVGVQIDAGCDHYTVTDNVLREAVTPITNTPGTSAGRRIVQDNVTA